MVNRISDVQDILDKVTTGWIPPPAQPLFVEEGRDPVTPFTFDLAFLSDAYMFSPPDNGVIFIKKDYLRERGKLSLVLENRVYTFNCIIFHPTRDGMELIFDQMAEVFDRYTNAPWSTSAIGTSTTYHYAGVDRSQIDPRPANAMDAIVQLAEFVSPVVIA